MVVNVSEAKAKLSQLIEMVYRGEEVTIAKNNLPIVDLVLHKPQKRRKLGLAKGKLKYEGDLRESDREIEEMFYGEES
ncbi:type II toxin-antitoxin system prevent-host-death family antitoxin [Hydrogenimonas sp. SS33]|uniref:type II toxin-antitoxin system Phd/YefM family antitoxin n=1 Tax=Hydrogenimonas leucolamina TaxID=2954236 RepID=UPI00336BB806